MLCNRGSAPSLGLNYIALHEMCPPVNNLRPPRLSGSRSSVEEERAAVLLSGAPIPLAATQETCQGDTKNTVT